jgi:hypothetical protein
MAKVVLTTVVVLALSCYGALFLSWNQTPQDIVTLQVGGTRFSQPLPIGALVFIGLVVGMIVMAVASWSAWAGQRGVAQKAAAQVKKAREKLQAQLDLINELRARTAELEAELANARTGNGTWGQVAAGDIAVPEVPAASAHSAEDPDVI